MSRSYAILGAGLMGRMMAYALAQGGARVEMFERSGPDAEQSAARVAASMLAPLAESAITEPSVVRMGLYGLDRWKSLIEQLNNKVEQQTFFQQDGTLVLWHRLDAAEAQRFAEHLERNVRLNPALSSPWHLDSKALAELEPSVAERFSQGLFLPREGQLDNRQLLTALLEALQQLDVKLHWHTACEPDDLADHGFDWVIDCRGLGAKSSWSNTHNPLRGVRGEVIRVHAPEVKLQRPTRLIHPRIPFILPPKKMISMLLVLLRLSLRISHRSAYALQWNSYQLRIRFTLALQKPAFWNLQRNVALRSRTICPRSVYHVPA